MLPGLAERRSEQLPAEVTPFVGREDELAQVTSLLRTSRLVTITGTGGVGKTRLALKAAAEVAGGYRDGARMAELSSVRDPELLVSAIAAVLGVSDTDSRSELDAVLEYLRRQQLLLILDTCEHLVDACALLAEAIMRESPEVTVLATSRQPLDAPGELTCALAPMRVPGPDDPADAGACDALALFTQRAAAARPGFAVTPENRADVVRVCERLDGIPLAIELAAVRLRALPLRDLVDRLDRKFQVLTGGRRVRQSRHQTLHGAIAWSYDLCTQEERALWARLSVFPGTFDIDSAEDVCADDHMDRDEITETIISLIDKSVVLRTGPDGERYRLLDTIREFGAERLAAVDLDTEFRARHVTRYLAVARDFAANFISDDQLERVRRLREEDANFRAAVDYALANGPDGEQDAARLVGALFPYWQISSRLREGRALTGKVLSRFPAPSRERASLLLDAAFLDAFQGECRGVEEAREGTRIAEELGEERLRARGFLAQNFTLTFAGYYAEALAAGAEAELRLEENGSRASLLALDAQMSVLLTLDGQFDEACERCERGLRRLGGSSGERWLQGYYHVESALALYHRPGKQRECAAAAAKGLPAKHEIGDVVGTGYGLEVYAWLAADAGRFERAAWLLGSASVLWDAAGARFHNNALLEQSHQAAARKACQGLPGGRFDELHAQGRACPLDAVVAQAVSDGDALPQPSAAPGESPTAGLTQREQEIAALVADGLSNREIAERLVISRRTVDAHVDHIYTKLGISNRVQLARLLSSPDS